MRLKQYLIFLVIFTIVYFIFFVFFDLISNKLTMKKYLKRARASIILNQYMNFASFYGVKGTVNEDLIYDVFLNLRNDNDIIITNVANFYKIDRLEFVAIVLYLEYLKLLKGKKIILDKDLITRSNYMDDNMAMKYVALFNNKSNLDTIVSNSGRNSITDLTYLNDNFLIPGIRLIDSKIYYVGDYL